MLPFVLLYLMFFFDNTLAGVNFTDCGNGNIKDLRITPCSGDPCVIKLGSLVQVEADFISPLDSETLSEVIKGVVNGKELPFPEARKEPCNGNIIPSCPIKQNKQYMFKTSFEVKSFYPAIPIKVKYSLVDPSGRMVMCVQLNAKIHDPNPKSRRKGRNKGRKSTTSAPK